MERPAGTCATASCFLKHSRTICTSRSRRVNRSASRRPPLRSSICSTLWRAKGCASRCRSAPESWRPAASKDAHAGYRARSCTNEPATASELIPEAIVAEYGMTELSSQYYDRVPADAVLAQRRKVAPPWLRARVVGPDRKNASQRRGRLAAAYRSGEPLFVHRDPNRRSRHTVRRWAPADRARDRRRTARLLP